MDEKFALFHRLVKKGDLPGIQRLIESGWDVNSALVPLLWTNGNTRVIRLLLAAGADVNAVNKFGESPLARAACQGKTKAVALLLQAGARTDVTPYGCSLLTWALAGEGRDKPKVIQLLREAGATAIHGNTHLKDYPPGVGPVG